MGQNEEQNAKTANTVVNLDPTKEITNANHAFFENKSGKTQQVVTFDWSEAGGCGNELTRTPVENNATLKVLDTTTKCFGVPDNGCPKEDLGTGGGFAFIKTINATGCSDKRRVK